MEHGVGQIGAIHQHLAAGAGHGGPGGGGLGVQALVHLARHGGADVEGGAGLALTKGIGAGRDRLGPQGLLGPAGRHLTAHHAGQVALQRHMVDRLQPAAAHQHLQPAPVAALAQLERAGLVRAGARARSQPEAAGQGQRAAGRPASAGGLELQGEPAVLQHQAGGAGGGQFHAPGLDLQGLVERLQIQATGLRQKHPHLRLAAAGLDGPVATHHQRRHGHGHGGEGQQGSPGAQAERHGWGRLKSDPL